MWYWRRIEKISWTDRVENEELLRKVEEECPAYRKWIGHAWHTNYFIKHVAEGKIEIGIEVT